jgi:hydroxypyruvate isomerase
VRARGQSVASERRAPAAASSTGRYQLAVNMSFVFSHLPLFERLDAAMEAGFDLVELRWPGPELMGRSLDELTEAFQAHGLRVALMNLPAGDLDAGDRGIAGDPGRHAEFRNLVDDALRFASQVGCRKVNLLAGNRVPGVSLRSQQQILAESLVSAADRASHVGIKVLVESLNTIENPRYLLATPREALALISKLRHPNLGFQFDVYHAVVSGQSPIDVVSDAAGNIGHVQLADHPGRHEPGTGKIDFASVIDALWRHGYRGELGLEYVPSSTPPDFGFLARLRKSIRGT